MMSKVIHSVALIAALTFGAAACDKDSAPGDEASTPEASTPEESAGSTEADDQAVSDESKQMSADLTIEYNFIAKKPVQDPDAKAWVRFLGQDKDEFQLFVATSNIDGVCEDRELTAKGGSAIKEGQYLLRFRSHNPLSKADKQAFEGKPATFDQASVTAYYYSSTSEKGTNSGWSADDKNKVTIEIEEVTDDFLVGTASAPKRDDDVSATFTAKICD